MIVVRNRTVNADGSKLLQSTRIVPSLNLPALHLHWKRKAIVTALKFSIMGNKNNQKDMTSRMRILMEFSDSDLTPTLLDVMSTIYAINKTP